MDSGDIQYLFKETRLNIEPPAPSSIVSIRVPSKNGNGRSQRRITHESLSEDETTFRLKNLSINSSIYHRKWHDTPRSFLWRVLEDGAVLSIRAADVCKKDKTPDAPLVLNFNFSVPIQSGCVAFSDPEEHDALCVYVLDQSSQLYTFTLRPEFFRKRTAIDAVLSELCKVQSPAGLGFKSPHRLVAVTANTLLVTVSDGGMIRFDKTKHDDSSSGLWKESFFNVQGWAQNLRSLLPFQGNHTIKHGKVNMEYSAATSIEVTDFGLEGCLFAITICLDHRIRIWNVNDGQILFTGDLLNVERTPQQVGKWSIDPSQSNLVQLVGHNQGQRICATYSPIGVGEFKFWKIIAKDAHTVIVEDLFPKTTLIPSTPSSSDIWTLADFILASPAEGSINLWTLWKNNMSYRVKRLELDRKNMAQSWEENWDGVYPDAGTMPVQTSGPCDSTDVTEKWLQCILQPGRFTKATLETALSIYERGLGTSKDGSNGKGRGLAESICSVLGATASLERGASGAMDYEQFRASGEIQWRRFYRLLAELDRQRGEAIGLAFDPETDMAWVICTDLVSAIRLCSDLERLYHNLGSPDEENASKAALVNAALSFVDGFSDNHVQLAQAALRQEIFDESSKTDLERIQYFSDKAGFWRGITDEDCAQVVDVLGANFAIVDDDLYAHVLDLMAAPLEARRRHLRYPLTEFGQKLVMKGVQDAIALQWNVCFSQVILLVHMEFEFDNEEDALHNRVDIGLVYRKLISALKRLGLLKWLAHTELSIPLSHGDRASQSKKVGDDSTQTVTALEANLGHLLGFDNLKKEPLSSSLADIITNLCAPDSDIEVSPALIQCALIKQDRADLALELVPFSDQNPFSVYVLGRVQLALNDFESAAISFRRAAIGMGTKTVPSDRHSCGLLGDTEWNLLNNGQAMYYSHIVAQYEAQKAYSYVVDFARLAMQFLDAVKDSSSAKVEMLSRLFNAALVTSQFELAHTSLLSIKDDALKHSSLRKLVDKMCETCHSMELVSLPFPGLQQEVDDILADRCRNLTDVVQGFPYHQVLYSWRIKRNNYRGAASVLLDRIQKLKLAGEGDKITGDDVLDTPVTRQYLLLINALSCVEPQQAWIFDEGAPSLHQNGDGASKRKVVSLADIRKQYQNELDRIAAIQNNQFGFEAGDVMEL
ncbi:Nucleoporin [Metarhizium anisopliae]|nr:Nucleoporin [Metarhizium anisopliae]